MTDTKHANFVFHTDMSTPIEHVKKILHPHIPPSEVKTCLHEKTSEKITSRNRVDTFSSTVFCFCFVTNHSLWDVNCEPQGRKHTATGYYHRFSTQNLFKATSQTHLLVFLK